MAYRIEEFVKLDRSRCPSSIATCAICATDIADVHPEEVRHVPDGPVHDDCFFDDLAMIVEKHPIGIPHVRR